MTDLDIDINRLDKECQSLPELFHEYAEKLATARGDVDRLKGVLDLTEARVDSDVRLNPSSYGLAKATETSVEKAVVMDDRYQKALMQLNKAKLEAGKLQAYVDALGVKKTSVELLVKLRLADYFSEPTLPKAERDRTDEDRRRRQAEDAPDASEVKKTRRK